MGRLNCQEGVFSLGSESRGSNPVVQAIKDPVRKEMRRAAFSARQKRFVDVLLMGLFQDSPLHAAPDSVDVGLQDELVGDRLLAIEAEANDDDGLECLSLEPGGVLAGL